jgi:multidrug efflux pump subunit AcrA (membrane-fusion protein)
MTGRRRLFAVVAGLVLLAVAAGWIASSQIRSPAEIAAGTAPPAAAPILVPAENRVLSTDIVTRGTARFGSPQKLSLARSALKPDAGIAAGLPLSGAELREGESIFTTSGRPVFLLTGKQPAFRDLGPGSEGNDVRQLEEALARLGFDPGPVDGVYDDATANAVSAWYEHSGFAPFTASPEQLTSIRALQAESNSSEIEVITARGAVATAQAVLDAANAAQARAVETSQRSQAAVDTAVALAQANDRAAAASVTAKQAVLDALSGSGTLSEIAAAKAELALAQANVDVTRLTGDRDVAVALDAAATARADVAKTQGDVKAAEAALSNANAALTVRKRQSDLAGSNLSLANLRAGVQVPADEVIFVASAPVRVGELLLTTGTPTNGPLMTVSDATVAVDGALRLEEASLVTPGMKVVIDEAALGVSATGVVSQVAKSPGTNGVDSFHVYFEIVVDGSPQNIVGASLRLTVPVKSTGGAVLVVPVSAVTLSADGSSRVQRQHNGALEIVTVQPGLSSAGFVQVKPLNGALEAGDLVVIGFDQSAAPK